MWQSPKEVVVKDINYPVTLYCICSLHSIATYKWEKIGEPRRQFKSTSVLYVRKEGLYMCKVEAGKKVRKSWSYH